MDASVTSYNVKLYARTVGLDEIVVIPNDIKGLAKNQPLFCWLSP